MFRLPRRRTLLGIALVGFIGLGIADGVLGTAWPFAREDFARPIEDLGFVITVLTVSGGAMAAISGRVSQRIGAGRLLVLAAATTAVGAVVWATAPTWPVFVLGVAVVGLGGGFFDPGINHHVARHHGLRSMNSLHLAFGTGATLGPLVMIGAIEATGTWRWGLMAIVAVYVPIAVAIALTRAQWEEPEGRRRTVAGSTARVRDVVRTLASFSVATGIEVAGGQWAFTILQARGSTDAVAAAFAAAYWGGLTGGRLVGAVFGHRIRRRTLLVTSIALLAVGYAAFWVDPIDVGAFGLPLAGAGMALVFPTLVLATESAHRGSSEVVMGWSFASAALGAAVLPWLAGIVGAATSLDVIPLVLLFATAALAALLRPLIRPGAEPPRVLHSPHG